MDRILREVRWCTRDDIRITVLMLSATPPGPVIEDTNRVNRGQALFTTNEDLDDYVLVDFVEYQRSVSRTR